MESETLSGACGGHWPGRIRAGRRPDQSSLAGSTCYCVGRLRGVKPMRDTDADEVADEVAIMEVVPKEDSNERPEVAQRPRERGGRCFDSLQLRAFVLAGATPGDAVDLDEGRGDRPPRGEQSDGVAYRYSSGRSVGRSA